jgi:hypothetical protein
MNSLLFSLLFCLAIVPAAQAGGSQWTGNVNMHIARHGSSSTCSDQAMQALNENVADWLQNEIVNLLGSEDAFRLGVVQGTDNNGELSLTASFDCLDCSRVLNKQSIAKVLTVFMEHRKDVWLHETDAAIREGCVGDHTTVSRVMVTDSAASPVSSDGRRATATSRSAVFGSRNASDSDNNNKITCDSSRENSLKLIPYAERSMSCEISS